MSGGHFDYKQWHIDNIANQIEQEVILSGKPIPMVKLQQEKIGLGLPRWLSGKEYTC